MFRQRKAKDKRNPQRNCTENEEQPSNCIICLDTVSCRGKLSVCKHWFCFHCIFEWSKNTNTCPICKARFRCITKVHLNTLKSPPKKVRVRDIDQRVWNEDDDIVADDLVDLSRDSVLDDFDDDYEPSVHVTNPWIWARQNNGGLGDYDLDDSFINDGAELPLVQDDESSDIEECMSTRESPYSLRRSGAAATISLTDSIVELADEDCPNIAVSSPAGTGSFIVSDDDLSDFNMDQWMPPGERTQNSRKNETHKEQTKRRKTSRATNPARKMPKSQTTVGSQVSTRSKGNVDDTSEEAHVDSGWINMNTRRENMRTLRSLPPRRASSRKCSRKPNQRGASQVLSDSDDSTPSYSAQNSSRPKKKGSENSQVSPSNLHLKSLPPRSKRQTSKRWTISSGESDESDSDHTIPANNKYLKGKGLGKEPSSYQSRSSLTSKTLTISSEESDDSDSDDLMPLSYILRTKSPQPNKGGKVTRSTRVSSCQENSSNSVLQEEQDSGSDDDALDCGMSTDIGMKSPSKKTASQKTGKTAVKSFLSVRIKDRNHKENRGCIAGKERDQCKKDLPPTTADTSDEGCIAPTPQQRRYNSIFTKRCHRFPSHTFEDSGGSDAEGCTYSQLPRKSAKTESGVSHFTRGKSSKLAEGTNDEQCVTNVRKCVKQNDSPIISIRPRNCRKRRRLSVVNSDTESD